MPHDVPRRVIATIAAALLFFGQLHAQDEVRALWVVRTTLTSPSAIATMVTAARSGGFNTLLVQVRGRGDAYFQQGIEPRPVSLAAQPAFDPLADAIAKAHEAGLRVHAWINVNLIASATDLPAAREHVVYRHPEWLMVPRALAEDLSDVDPHSPGYIGRLARYARSQSAEVEGLYLSPVSAESVTYTTSVVRDIAQRYDIDGVHFDYIRYPTSDFDYSRDTLAAFRGSLTADLAAGDQRRYDARAAAGEPLVYTQAFPDRWRTFRSAHLTTLLTSLRAGVKAVRPAALVSVAVVPDPREAAMHRLQDWRGWLDAGLVDVVCPMAYTTDAGVFAAQIAAVKQIAGSHPIWAGIGAYRLSSDQIVEDAQTARRLGVGGIILFSYDSLADATHGPGYVAQVGRAAFQF
ncbi:MAG TPA: family 10 glycosylhydrolase [Vicinamibacterales bacterium]|nr:family 10 glycosylhydrolase [Vicinamibacterales bacterium]